MSRVLMLMPPFVKGWMRNGRWDGITISGTMWYPIFLAEATGLLESKGHTVKLLDAQVDNLTKEQVYDIAKEFKPDLTVVSFSMKSLDNDVQITAKISEVTDCDTVFVGYASSFDPPKVLSMSPRVNKIIKGEYDFGILDLANKVPTAEIKGLVWKDLYGLHENQPREPITAEQFEQYPFVTSVYKRHLNMKKYYLSGHLDPYVDLFTGRGCAYGVCSFCSWPATMYGGIGCKYRKRSIGKVMDELRYIKEELPFVKDVFFQDDTMPTDRAREISEAILESHLKIRWSCYSRAEKDYETMKLMHRAGCYLMETGFESSNQKVLDGIHKGVTVAQMEKYAADAHRAGITLIGAFITGLPYETIDSIKATTKWISQQPILRYTITLPKPYKGTGFYDTLEKNGWLKGDKPNYPQLSTEQIYEWNKWSLKHSYLNFRFFSKMLMRPQDWIRVLKGAYYFLPYLFNKEKNDNKELEW
jgi:anaerobic magnesium-protoporphyrin IX monomethyl ester cyclase